MNTYRLSTGTSLDIMPIEDQMTLAISLYIVMKFFITIFILSFNLSRSKKGDNVRW
ncbi:hypothetical protein HOY80DRAFT_1028522 [Tuber brumale]|nr:hypothetical protein HOY80DRAFT_1028522 [Tuber brumale]